MELNRRIDGPSHLRGNRRALPACCVAGVRGLIYGDGERVGYHHEINVDNIAVNLHDSDVDDENNENIDNGNNGNNENNGNNGDSGDGYDSQPN